MKILIKVELQLIFQDISRTIRDTDSYQEKRAA